MKIFLTYQLFIRFNFVLMYYVQFLPKSSLKFRFFLFNPEKVTPQRRFEIPAVLDTFSGLKRTNLNFKLLLGGNWPYYIKIKLNLIKSWYVRKIFVFPNSHFLIPWPPLTSIYLKRGEPKYLKVVSNHSIYHNRQYALYIFSV